MLSLCHVILKEQMVFPYRTALFLSLALSSQSTSLLTPCCPKLHMGQLLSPTSAFTLDLFSYLCPLRSPSWIQRGLSWRPNFSLRRHFFWKPRSRALLPKEEQAGGPAKKRNPVSVSLSLFLTHRHMDTHTHNSAPNRCGSTQHLTCSMYVHTDMQTQAMRVHRPPGMQLTTHSSLTCRVSFLCPHSLKRLSHKKLFRCFVCKGGGGK